MKRFYSVNLRDYVKRLCKKITPMSKYNVGASFERIVIDVGTTIVK